MKRYSEYKDSGVKWIGEIPKHWKKMRYKDIFEILDEKVGAIKNLTLLSLTKKGVIVRDLSEGKGKFPKDFESYKIVHPNNLILCLFDVDETPRTVGVSNTEGMITGAYDIFSVKNALLDYVYYLYISFDDKKCLKPLYKGLRKVIPLPVLLSSYIYLPLGQEQQAIVAYLNNKVSKIDKYISTAEKKIAALDELKQVTIADAVTHGINPNAPMKDSEIPWIGMVPEHWTRARYKDILNIEDEKVGKRNDLTLLSLTKRGVLIRDLSEGKGKFPKDYESYKVVNPNNIILCLFDVDETPRTVGISHNKGMITGAYDIFEIRNVKLEYIYYLYLSIDDKKGFKSLYKGLRKVIPLPSLLSAYINLPPISEQNKIVAYIDRKVAQIDKMKAAELAQIDKLKEYKQRLISDVVTGKVKVTNE